MANSKVTTLVRSIRFPFLVLTPVCVFLGISTAYQFQGQVAFWPTVLVMVGAIASHVSVNAFNEYLDFRSGLDATTTQTPFSGGSGALVDHPEAMSSVLYLAIAALALTLLIGLYVVQIRGWPVLLIGLFGVTIILTYTQWLNRLPWLCLVAPGVAFGPLMVTGTHVVLTGQISQLALAASLVPFFLINNLLLLNQYPDIDADAGVGRNHFPIRYGVKRSTYVYGAFVLATVITLVAGIRFNYLPNAALASLIPMTAAALAFWGAIKYASDVERLVPFLALNVVAAVLTPATLGLTLILG